MTRAALAICVVLAWGLARRVPHPRQRVIVAALTGLLAIDVVRPMLRRWPTLDVAAFALWYAVGALAVWSVLAKDKVSEAFVADPLLATVRRVSSSGRQRLNVGSFFSRSAAFRSGSSATYLTPILLALVAIASPIAYRHGVDVGRASFALSLAAQLLAVARFASRGRMPDDAQRVALILAASSLADIAGPWLLGEPARDWFVGRWPAVITWTVVAAWETRCLTRARR